MFFSDEQIERANGQGITEYFRRNGYSCDREGREMHIHGFGGLKVREDTQEYYIHSRHIGGRGLVSCLMNTFDMSFADAVRTALDGEKPTAEYASERKILPKRNVSASDRKKELAIPSRAADNKRIFVYLSKERCISPCIISELIRSGKLYQDDKGNAVFLHHRDNAPCGAEIHGTGRKKYVIGNKKYDEISDKRIASVAPFEAEMLSRFLEKADVDYTGYVYSDEANIIAENKDFRIVTDVIDLISDERFNTSDINRDISKKLKNFKGVSQGTTDSYFEYDRGKPDKAYIFESAIDLMSFMQLHPDADNCKFVAMAGLKPSAVEDIIGKGLKIVFCVDNDNAGRDFVRRFSGRCSVFTECSYYGVKDFNELLQKRFPRKSFPTAVGDMTAWADNVQRDDLQTGRKER